MIDNSPYLTRNTAKTLNTTYKSIPSLYPVHSYTRTLNETKRQTHKLNKEWWTTSIVWTYNNWLSIWTYFTAFFTVSLNVMTYSFTFPFLYASSKNIWAVMSKISVLLCIHTSKCMAVSTYSTLLVTRKGLFLHDTDTSCNGDVQMVLSFKLVMCFCCTHMWLE